MSLNLSGSPYLTNQENAGNQDDVAILSQPFYAQKLQL